MSSPESDTTDRVPTKSVTHIKPQPTKDRSDASHGKPGTSSKRPTTVRFVDLPTDGIKVSGEIHNDGTTLNHYTMLLQLSGIHSGKKGHDTVLDLLNLLFGMTTTTQRVWEVVTRGGLLCALILVLCNNFSI